MKFYYRFFIVTIFLSLITSCAKKGRPEGGPKDETAPLLVTAKPPYKTLNFKEDEIRIYFDEYIVLKDLSKQLVVSPPLKNPPLISPQGTPSKYITIQLFDTLQPNTTYTFNFGSAVQDNNENNKLENFKYIFSTGDYIDSLKIKGSVGNVLEPKPKKNISVLLYELDSTYTDSTFYKKKPNYVTNTIDSVNFQFENLRKGKYLMMAIDETSSDYIFNSKTDKLAFFKDTISLPRDTIVLEPLITFKEDQPYSFKRGREITKGKILFGFEGEQENMKVVLTSQIPDDFKAFSQFEKEKDTLNYWFTPIEADSLNFIVSNSTVLDTVTVRLRKKQIDSLAISSSVSSTLHLKDTVFLKTNNPIVNIDKTKFTLVSKDSIPVDYSLKQQEVNKLAVLFTKEQKTNYKLTVFPNGILDVFETPNDTLTYKFSTKGKEDYGSIVLKVQKEIKTPIIIELLTDGNLVKQEYVKDSKEILFDLLQPKEYSIRAIIDANENKVWDTGVFLKKQQPEKIIYFTKELKLRANWSINETFIIE